MFKAFVIVCILVSPQVGEQCQPFEDTWGPYNTFENCSIRVDQMAEDLFTSINPYYSITSMTGICSPLSGELS
jgi:hypothetical protein